MKNSNTKSRRLRERERSLKINIIAMVFFLSLALFTYSFHPKFDSPYYLAFLNRVILFLVGWLGKWETIFLWLALAYYNFVRALILIIKPRIVEK